ncbi:hypothetical protein OF83DRAFT_1238921 [Amylostereum chailletii]|nr:hypothetical protein OF83DRAFT_1238921 [Amylostereum chailletii]
MASPCVEEWRALSTLFTIDLPYKPPSSRFGAWLWRWRLWFEVTFGASVLEPWEKLVFMAVVTIIISLIGTACYKFLPHTILMNYQRTLYYAFGSSAKESAAVQRILQGASTNASAILRGVGRSGGTLMS